MSKISFLRTLSFREFCQPGLIVLPFNWGDPIPDKVTLLNAESYWLHFLVFSPLCVFEYPTDKYLQISTNIFKYLTDKVTIDDGGLRRGPDGKITRGEETEVNSTQ